MVDTTEPVPTYVRAVEELSVLTDCERKCKSNNMATDLPTTSNYRMTVRLDELLTSGNM